PTSTAGGSRTPVRSRRWYGRGPAAARIEGSRMEGMGRSPWSLGLLGHPRAGDAADDVGEQRVALVAELQLGCDVGQGLHRVVEGLAAGVVAVPGRCGEHRAGGDVEGFHLPACGVVDVFAGVARLRSDAHLFAVAGDHQGVLAADRARRNLRVVTLLTVAVLPGVVPLAVAFTA